jgi:catabolite regulation protein CreA
VWQFSDPSQGGLSCTVKPGKVVVSTAASTSKDGEEVFSESRSLVFKSLKVRRLVDREGESVVYAVFSQRLDKNEDSNNSRFKSALCAVRRPHRTSQQQVSPSHQAKPAPCASQVHVDKFETAASTQ